MSREDRDAVPCKRVFHATRRVIYRQREWEVEGGWNRIDRHGDDRHGDDRHGDDRHGDDTDHADGHHDDDGHHSNGADSYLSHTGYREPGSRTGFHSNKLEAMLHQLHLTGTGPARGPVSQ